MFGSQTVTVRHTRRKFSTTHYYESISFRDVSVIHLHDAIAPMNLTKFELGDLERGKKICRKDNYSPRKYIHVKRSKQS